MRTLSSWWSRSRSLEDGEDGDGDVLDIVKSESSADSHPHIHVLHALAIKGKPLRRKT